MNIIRLFIVTLLLMSMVAAAKDCNSPSPGKLDGTLRSQVEAEPLTIKQRIKVVSFLKTLYKDRDGVASGYFCKKGKGKVKVSSESIKLRTSSHSKNNYKVKVTFKTDRNYGISSEYLSYSIGEDKLYSSPNESGYQAIVRKISNKEVVLLEKYRFSNSMTKEIIRHYKLRKELVVKNTYYVNGALQGEMEWVF